MRLEYNIYCDETCHLLHSDSNIMVFGAVWCLTSKRHQIFKRIREIKEAHKLSPSFEIKWNKVSPAKVNFYMDIINYFFDDDDLHFRALIIPDKTVCTLPPYNNQNEFYYAMWFNLLKVILSPECAYNIYLDRKDTQSQHRVNELLNKLRNNHYDYHNQIIKNIQQVQSDEVETIQLTDLLVGAIGYVHRNLNTSTAKQKLIERIKQRSGYSLQKSTLYKEEKMNLFIAKNPLNTNEQS